MARPHRRRPTLPDHDPRSVRAELRRDVYALGNARRSLDTVEFRARHLPPGLIEPPGPALEVLVNGVSSIQDLGRAPVPAWMQWIPSRSLRDHEGKRRAIAAMCPCGVLGCQPGEVLVAVAGRYVMWDARDHVFGETLVFDRSTYRESLEAALKEVRFDETREEWALREVLERADWRFPMRLGLQLHHARVEQGSLVLEFADHLWTSTVWCSLPWRGAGPSEVKATLMAIARWETESWHIEWRPWWPEAVIPPYPSTWIRTQRWPL